MQTQYITSFVPPRVDQVEDVDIGTNDEPYEQSVPAEDMEVDEKPQVSAFPRKEKKRLRLSVSM